MDKKKEKKSQPKKKQNKGPVWEETDDVVPPPKPKKLPKKMQDEKGFFRRIWGYLKSRPPKYKGTNSQLDNRPMWNIYDPKLGNKKLFKKFNLFQYIFKYKFIVPLVIIAEKFLDKMNMRKVPDYHYNKNLQIFSESFEKALEDWIVYYIRRNCEAKYQKRDYQFGGSARMLRTFRDLVIGGALYDTAYREFFNMLMFHIGMEMNKEYTKDEVGMKRIVHHLVYPSNSAYNVNYWAISQQLQGRIDLENLNKTRNRPSNMRDEKKDSSKVRSVGRGNKKKITGKRKAK